MSMRCLATLAGLAATGCSILNPSAIDTRLEIELSGSEQLAWPIPEEGEIAQSFVETRNSPADPSGLAGLELQVSGGTGLTVSATDFDANGKGPIIDVPESGSIHVHVRLRQDGVVAEGRVSWALARDAIWTLRVSRSPYVWGMDGTPENPKCYYPWCRVIKRFVIEESARNYPAEALWLEVELHPWEGPLE
ncbi:hypothetical protein [Candidatus Palauibacter sp.]|uniref:hypothetical protein n=1 Tax=Candidatus Palauibacter sp. TaxID=3101350 RepID=UPI003B58C259